jgi:hypothetical protein
MGLVSALPGSPVLALPPVVETAGVVASGAPGPLADEVLDVGVAQPAAAEIVSSNPSARPASPRTGRGQ